MTQSCPPQPQVSVIVPVYNQERYLEECISSIRRQTLAEWECLIINDGSSDSSGEIARRFSEADSRIRYFEQKNGGVSSARNLGMRRASGRYLCFVDGDDFIDAAFLKHLLDASDRGASDLTVAGKLFCDRFPPDKIPALPTCGIFLRREFPLKNNLEFPEGIHPCEDGLFSHFALSRQGGKARLEASSYEHDDKRVCELHHFRVSLPIEGGPPPWAFRKSRIPACLRSLFAAPKYPHFREEKRHGFNPGLAAPPRRHTYFKGYFQTEQYFLHCREQLCREFRLKTPLTPENARILEDIRSCCSISLHIRRTDYLSNPYLSPPPLEYYLRSMAEMEGRLRAAGAPQESLRYFIFSDDIEWARQNLRPALPHVHVDINDGGAGYFDLELMRNCRHHIIANSTFSWWAAYLNEHAEKIVIAPRIWFNREEGDRYHTDDALIPGSWLRI